MVTPFKASGRHRPAAVPALSEHYQSDQGNTSCRNAHGRLWSNNLLGWWWRRRHHRCWHRSRRRWWCICRRGNGSRLCYRRGCGHRLLHSLRLGLNEHLCSPVDDTNYPRCLLQPSHRFQANALDLAGDAWCALVAEVYGALTDSWWLVEHDRSPFHGAAS